MDSTIKEDSRNIYFVGVCSYREKRRGENVNMHAIPFPQCKFYHRKLRMNTELPESLIVAAASDRRNMVATITCRI